MLQFKALAAENEHLKRALANQTPKLSIQEEAMKFIGKHLGFKAGAA